MRFSTRAWIGTALAVSLTLGPFASASAGASTSTSLQADEWTDVDSSQVGQESTGSFDPTGSAGFDADLRSTRAIKIGPCTLYPSVVHTRKSGNWTIVGSKPYTQCTTAVTSISHRTTMYKTALFGTINLNQGIYNGGNRGVARYEQKTIDTHCTNSKSTTWFSVTNGTIVYRGTTYYAQVISPHATYNCGT